MSKPLATLTAVLVALSSATAGAAGHQARVVGGTPASRAYEHHALVLASLPGGSAQCAGTLVARRFVLTAGHCVSDEQGAALPAAQVRVGLGSPRLSAITDVYRVVAVARHPSFALRRETGAVVPNFDVAMLLLDRPAPYGTARLADGEAQPGSTATTIGWGVTETGAGSDVLREATVLVRTQQACATAYGAAFDARTMFCAGSGGQDACEGDSGGPLLAGIGPAPPLVGVVSFGFGCGDPRFPGVYARVTAEPLAGWVRAQHPRAAFAATPAVPEAGQPVALTSTSHNPVAGYSGFDWDLDGDGAFDDARGPTVQTAFERGTHDVGLRATNADGDAEIARAHVEARASTPASFGQSAFRVAEGRALSVPIVVTRPAPGPGGTGTVQVMTQPGRDAVPGRDYNPALSGGAPAFGPDDVARSVALATVEDGLDERDETVALWLGPATGALIPGEPTRATVTIRDDDPPRRLGHRLGPVRADGTLLLRTSLPAPGRVAVGIRRAGSRRRVGAGDTRRTRAGRATVRVRLTGSSRRELRRRARLSVAVTVRFTSALSGETSVSSRRARLGAPAR